MEFQKYPSIEGIWRDKEIDYFERHVDFDDYIWCVTEKAHGTNFAFYYDGEEIKCGRRNGFITGNFYNYEEVLEKYKRNVKEIYQALDLDTLILYGEMIGGLYEHPDITNKCVSMIQKEVQYCPDREFYLFDIVMDGKWRRHNTVELIGDAFGIPFARILQVGSYEEVKEYPAEFQTTIPEQFGLPEIEGNVCEGIVIKPLTPVFVGDKRLILKKKNTTFKEQKPKKRKKRKKLSDVSSKYLDEISNYITENRLRSVLSKFEEVTEDDFMLIFNAFKKDVYTDFEKENDLRYPEVEAQRVDKSVGKMCADVWRPIFLKLK